MSVHGKPFPFVSKAKANLNGPSIRCFLLGQAPRLTYKFRPALKGLSRTYTLAYLSTAPVKKTKSFIREACHVNAIKLLTFVADEETKQARVFVPGKPIQPVIIAYLTFQVLTSRVSWSPYPQIF